MKKVFPDSEHRNCVRHIYQNFHKVHQGEQLKNDLWAIARSTNEAAYTRNMDKMRDHNFAAFNWVENLSPRTWIKAFFDPFCKCDILLNNMCEVFNRLVSLFASMMYCLISVAFAFIDCVNTYLCKFAATFWMVESCQLNQCWITSSGRLQIVWLVSNAGRKVDRQALPQATEEAGQVC